MILLFLQTYMNKLSLAIRSRTVWTIVALFVINGIEGIREFFSPQVLTVVDAVLGLTAVYFRLNIRAK